MSTGYEHLDFIALKNTGIIFFVKPFPVPDSEYFSIAVHSRETGGRLLTTAIDVGIDGPASGTATGIPFEPNRGRMAGKPFPGPASGRFSNVHRRMAVLMQRNG
ncbi:hypothetical protein DSCA_15560 [Desulfosarcina alkanivorans]|uniref:Uncharacterized protein n=1 Tax=Desulfosarcina alkanivorans TaxID=571177 RepID=A0A5K7YF21_9BACT|nr:hypothetical protein [Desulfosarcina alkanivorans]BBO67626.1 hypothetical protein DSCA_15560 [Desulfosarcina alkanivorans]